MHVSCPVYAFTMALSLSLARAPFRSCLQLIFPFCSLPFVMHKKFSIHREQRIYDSQADARKCEYFNMPELK